MARNIVSGFLSIFSSRIAVLLITFVSTPVIARLLGTAGYGDFQTVTAIFSMLMIFVSSGISEGVQKFTGQRETTGWRSNVIAFYLRAGLAVAVLMGLGLLTFTALGFADLAGEGFEIYFYLLVVLVLAAQLREYTRRALMGLDLERYSEPLVVANTFIWVVIGIALAKYWATTPTEQVMSLLIGQIVAGFAVATVGFPLIFSRADVGRVFDRTPSDYPVREFLSFNGMTIVLLLLVTSLYKVDIVLIRAWIGASSAGIYSAALALAEYLWFIPTTLQILFIHSTSDLWEKRRISIIDDMASRATRYTALVVALMALGIAALAPVFVPWYYSQSYAAAVEPLYVLLPGAVALAIARPMFSIGQGNGNLRPLIAATGVAAGVNLLLNVVLIPEFGIIGAAFATSVGYASMLVTHTWSARYIGFNPVNDLRAGRTAATVALSAVPILWLPGFIADVGLETVVVPGAGVGVPTALFVVPVVGAVVYTLIAVGTGALDVDEVLEILASFPDPVGTRASELRSSIDPTTFDTAMLSKLLTGAGILLLALGLVLSVGTLFSGSDGGPSAVTNGTPTETDANAPRSPAGDATGGTASSTTSDAPTDDAGTTPATQPPPETDPPDGTSTAQPPTTEPGTEPPTETETETETPTDPAPTFTPTPTPGGANDGTATPTGDPTQAPGGDEPNVGTGTPATPGGDDDGDLLPDLPGDGDENDTPTSTPPTTPTPDGANDGTAAPTENPTDTPSETPTASPTPGSDDDAPATENATAAPDTEAPNAGNETSPPPEDEGNNSSAVDPPGGDGGNEDDGGLFPDLPGDGSDGTATPTENPTATPSETQTTSPTETSESESASPPTATATATPPSTGTPTPGDAVASNATTQTPDTEPSSPETQTPSAADDGGDVPIIDLPGGDDDGGGDGDPLPGGNGSDETATPTENPTDATATLTPTATVTSETTPTATPTVETSNATTTPTAGNDSTRTPTADGNVTPSTAEASPTANDTAVTHTAPSGPAVGNDTDTTTAGVTATATATDTTP